MLFTGLSEAGDGSEDEGHFLLRASPSSVFVTLSAGCSGRYEEIPHYTRKHNVLCIDMHMTVSPIIVIF